MIKRVLAAAVSMLMLAGSFSGMAMAQDVFTDGYSVLNGVSYLPYVSAEMAEPSFWSDDSEVLMTWDEIMVQNELNINASGTNMFDLKNHKETVNGVSLNSGLKSSSKADSKYYLGWTYLGEDTLATEKDWEPIIENTQNPDARMEQEVLYAIAVKRSELRTFPTPLPIWDDLADKDFDYQYLASIRVNEPLVITSVSADGKYYAAKNVCCSGWIAASDVAICKDKEEWLSAWDIAPENSLVVYGDKVYTETSIIGAKTSELMLTMGTVLELADITDPNVLIDNRAAYQNYAVWVPVRNEDGSYDKKLTLIPQREKVNVGYLPLTEANIMDVSFNELGKTYGWGGSLMSDDCSGYARNVYKCFGLELARNGTWQAAMPVVKVSMSNMCLEEKEMFIDALPAGALLYFSGHEMIYLGKSDDRYFVVSAVGSIMRPGGDSVKQRIRGTIINTLDIKRANGKTWLESLTAANVPYWSVEKIGSYGLPQGLWYRDSVSYCVKNGIMTNRDNGYFCPEENVTCAELAQMMWVVAGKPQTADTDNGTDSTPAMMWAVSEGICEECGADCVVTCEDVIAAMWNYAKQNDAAVSDMDAVMWACENGIVDSAVMGDALIRNIDRAQAAVMMHRFDSLMKAVVSQ